MLQFPVKTLPVWTLACCLLNTAGVYGATGTTGAPGAPRKKANAPVQQTEWAYRVESGDTLLALQARWLRPGARWQTLQKLNRVADPRRLQPGSVLRFPLALLREEPLSAEVLHSHGQAWLERADGTRQVLQAAAAVVAGDVLVTGEQSSLSLRFADGSRSQLGPHSRLRLERMVRLGASTAVQTRLRLDSGAVDSQVTPNPVQPGAPHFELRSPVINLGVRGTEFRARSDGIVAQAEVLQGKVAAGPHTVAEGYGVSASASGVSAPRALLPAPDLSALPALVQRLPLQWDLAAAASGAAVVRYRAQLYALKPAEHLVLDGLFEQARVTWADKPADGSYALRVRAVDASGLEGHDARLAFILKAQPEPPFLLRPRSLERLSDEQITLAWSRNPQATSVKLQVASRADFSALLLERDGLTDTELRVALPLGTWHWRLAAVAANGDAGPWGDALSFERFEPPPPPPVPPPPAPGAQAPKPAEEGVMLNWSSAPGMGVSYQVQVARDAAFTDLVMDQKTQRTELLLAKPESGVYYVRLRSIGADGRAGAYGSTQVLEVPRTLWWLWLLPLLLLL